MKFIFHTYHKICVATCYALLLLVVGSCVEDDVHEVFDKSPSERSSESIQTVRALLKSSETGWFAAYKPSYDETGYYNFYFKFLEDSIVEVASDFSPDDFEVSQSTWDVLQGSTTKLSFTTFSPLHKLSDSNYSPIPGQSGAGLKGDFEFLYYGTTEEGNIIFRTNRTQDTLIFQKASVDVLDDLKTGYQHYLTLLTATSVYPVIKEITGDQEYDAALDFPYDARVITVRPVEATDAGGETLKEYTDEYMIGYGLTSDGIFLDSLVLGSGTVVKNVAFVYEENEGFVAHLDNGTELRIYYALEPVIPVDGHKYVIDASKTYYTFFRYQDAYMGLLTSPAFHEFYYNVATTMPISTSFTIYMHFTYGGEDISYIYIPGTASVTGGAIRQKVIYESLDDRLILHNDGFRDANSAVAPEYEAAYQVLTDILTAPEGFYVENMGRATVYTNLVFTYTSAKNPAFRFGTYHVSP